MPQRYLYLSLIPESLIASMLPPEEFGNYYAVGTRKRSRGQALFFEVDPDFASDAFPMEEAARRCVAHPDGRPKRSVYLSVYRVLENVPTSALRKLYLVTDDGRVLGLDQAPPHVDTSPRHYFYQEFCPVTPRVVSHLDPVAFGQSITDPTHAVHVPRIVYCDLRLNKLARDPDAPDIEDLPYKNIGHLRDCLRELEHKSGKANKAVNRGISSDVLFRTIEHGFFVADADQVLYYPMPSHEQLEREYYEWWRSALTTFGE